MSAVAAIDDGYFSTGATAERASGPVGGPGAWRGVDMAERPDEWLYSLSSAEITELADAIHRTRSKDIINIERADFVLPTLGGVFDEMRRELLNGRGFVVIRGIPVTDYGVEEAARVYFGLGRYFGNARSQNGKGHVLGHVCDLGARYDAFKNPGKARIYQTKVRQLFHTDGVDIVSLSLIHI